MSDLRCGGCGNMLHKCSCESGDHDCTHAETCGFCRARKAEVKRLRAERDSAREEWAGQAAVARDRLDAIASMEERAERAEAQLAKVMEALHADPPLVMPKDEYDRITSLPSPPIGMAWGAGYRAAQRAALAAVKEKKP